MTDQPPRPSDERLSPIMMPTEPPPVYRPPWWRRHSPSTMIATLLLLLFIAAAFVYAFRIEASREDEISHRSP